MLPGKSYGEVKMFGGVKNSKMGDFLSAHTSTLAHAQTQIGGVGLVRVGGE